MFASLPLWKLSNGRRTMAAEPRFMADRLMADGKGRMADGYWLTSDVRKESRQPGKVRWAGGEFRND